MANRGTARNRTLARKERQAADGWQRELLVQAAVHLGANLYLARGWSMEHLRNFIMQKKPALRDAVSTVRRRILIRGHDVVHAELSRIGTETAELLRALVGGR